MIKKILIANRGEIALRIQRTAHKMGIATVAIYAIADKDAAFVKQANEAVLLKGDQLSETYLNKLLILDIAKKTNADAIHPGYGFLSENAEFVELCKKSGIIFIGPDAGAMQMMGNKIAARTTALKSGVPVTPGITGTADELLNNYQSIGFPLLIKAAAGGGGKGMRVVHNESEIKTALEATAREAKNYFGDDAVYIEKYIGKPRHIEVQILGDQHGNTIHLYERECSLQRRHQKIVEEAPSPTLTPQVRKKICDAAVQLAQSIGYYSAGTMEFLLDEDLNFYFLEMNTRIQVEHPVTELTTGIDIVAQQINIANGEALKYALDDIQQHGHAIECRIYAENPEHFFLPSPGLIQYYEEPAQILSDGNTVIVRVDGMQLQTGDTVSGDFDPMISKLIVWANTREKASLAMLSALNHYHIKGITTNIHFLKGLIQYPDFINNAISTKYIDSNLQAMLDNFKHKKQDSINPIPIIAAICKSLIKKSEDNIWQTIGYWRHIKTIYITIDGKQQKTELIKNSGSLIVLKINDVIYNAQLELQFGICHKLKVNDEIYTVNIYEPKSGTYEVDFEGSEYEIIRTDISTVDDTVFEVDSRNSSVGGSIVSPMPGKVIKLNVVAGDTVKKGDVLLIVEAMKMENNIISPADGKVESINIQVGDKVDTAKRLVILSELTSV